MVIIVDFGLVSNFRTLFRRVHLEKFIFKFIFTILLNILVRNSSGRVAFIVFYPLSFTLSCLMSFSIKFRTVLWENTNYTLQYFEHSYSCNCTHMTLSLLLIFKKISNKTLNTFSVKIMLKIMHILFCDHCRVRSP